MNMAKSIPVGPYQSALRSGFAEMGAFILGGSTSEFATMIASETENGARCAIQKSVRYSVTVASLSAHRRTKKKAFGGNVTGSFCK